MALPASRLCSQVQRHLRFSARLPPFLLLCAFACAVPAAAAACVVPHLPNLQACHGFDLRPDRASQCAGHCALLTHAPLPPVALHHPHHPAHPACLLPLLALHAALVGGGQLPGAGHHPPVWSAGRQVCLAALLARRQEALVRRGRAGSLLSPCDPRLRVQSPLPADWSLRACSD